MGRRLAAPSVLMGPRRGFTKAAQREGAEMKARLIGTLLSIAAVLPLAAATAYTHLGGKIGMPISAGSS